jgi:hypothetical protein
VRRAVLVLGILALAGCSSERQVAAPPSAAPDVRLLVERIEAIHPDPWHAVSEEEFKAAARELGSRIDDLNANEKLVELMRFAALLGERDGHSGIFPLDETHDPTLHLYPIRLYEFSDGLFVVDAIDRPELVGARLVSIAGRPVDEVMAAVRPLVPADNEWSLKARLPQYLLVAEVLRGLGYASPAFDFDDVEATLEPVEAAEYAAAFPDLFHPMVPQGLPPDVDNQVVKMLDGGRVVYAAYNVTLGDTTDFADEIVRRADGVRRVVIDLRNNPGGNNGTYPPLLEALTPLDVVALIGRTTFSAAANFITELERTADVLFVGEPSGGAPNLYGDPVAVSLPATGWTVNVAGVYWEKSEAGDPRLAIEPDIPVELSSEDFFAGRDPVLNTALRPTPR